MNKRLFWTVLTAASFFLLFINGIILYFAPGDSVAYTESWQFFRLPKEVWKLDFIFLFLLFIVSTVFLLLSFKKQDLLNLIQFGESKIILKQKELWIAVGIIFIGFSLFGLEIPALVKLARIEKISNTVSSTDNIQESSDIAPLKKKKHNKQSSISGNQAISIGDMDLTLVAENFVDLSAKKILGKLNQNNIKASNINETLYEISDNNNGIALNEIYRIIAEGEEINRSVRNGKPVSERSLKEVGREIGIDQTKIAQIFNANKVSFSGSMDQKIKEISQQNNISALDIYGLLNGKELTGAPANIMGGSPSNNGAAQKSIASLAKNMTVGQFVNKLKQSQPGLKVDKESVLGRLMAAKLTIPNENATLGEIAQSNSISTEELLNIISGKNQEEQTSSLELKKMDGPQSAKTKRRQEILNASLDDLAVKNGKKPELLVKTLNDAGIQATKNQSIQEIAKNNNKKPGEILKILKAARK